MKKVTQEEVIAKANQLGGLARTANGLLADASDMKVSLKVLASEVQQDPVLAARVLSVANRAVRGSRREGDVIDLYAAAAMIGVNQLRELILVNRLNALAQAGKSSPMVAIRVRRHALAVSVCAQELAIYSEQDICLGRVLVTGLLHNIGQIWLCYRYDKFYGACLTESSSRGRSLEEIEREQFGVDHCTVGAWLLEHWRLPTDICSAVHGYRAGMATQLDPLTALVHVGDVVSNALGLAGIGGDRVTSLSRHACQALGLDWGRDARHLFGRVEARVRYSEDCFSCSDL